ncbi:MAG: hypothetical protein JNL01_07925 [Bdellovibrionales bacterium]|nr:hypothetical protein [Bdellovibrionales bacterium]
MFHRRYLGFGVAAVIVFAGLQACNDGGGGGGQSAAKEECTTWECWARQDPSTWPTGLPSGFPSGLPIPPTQGTNPNSADGKIMKDLEDQKITVDQAWVYRVQARVHPAALPTQYRPTPSVSPSPAASGGVTHDDTELSPQLLNAAQAALPSLGLDAQLAIIPYLLPPSNPESFYSGTGKVKPPVGVHSQIRANPYTLYPATGLKFGQTAASVCAGTAPIPEPFPAGAWVFVDDGDFRFWYKNEQGSLLIPPSQYYTTLINMLKPALVTAKAHHEALTGQTILNDSGSYTFTAQDGSQHVWCDGGNGKLDIYLAPISDARGLTVTYPNGCSKRPSFIILDPHRPYVNQKYAEFAITHELFHVFQFTFERNLSCDDYADTDEGIANWATHHTFPSNDIEHEWELFTHYGRYSLIDAAYDTWVFYLAMEKKFGTAWVRDLYLMEKGLNPIRSMDKIFSGGFKKIWPEFSVTGWNQEGNPPSFKQWDGFEEHPQDSTASAASGFKIQAPVKLDGKGDFEYEKLLEFPMGLTRAYEHFTIDPNVKTLTLSWNRGGAEEEDFHLRVLIKKNGSWSTEDWDPKPGARRNFQRQFCFDEPGVGPIEEMVMVFSRSDFEAPFGIWDGTGKVRLSAKANNMPCYVVTGKMQSSMRKETGVKGTGNYNLRHIVVNYNLSFKAKRDSDGRLTDQFELLSGLGDYAYQVIEEDIDPCGPASFGTLCRVIQNVTNAMKNPIFSTEGAGSKTNTSDKINTCTSDGSGTFTLSQSGSRFSAYAVYSFLQGNPRTYGAGSSPENPKSYDMVFTCTDTGSNRTDRELIPAIATGSGVVDPNGYMKGGTQTSAGNKLVWEFIGTK